jgi:hypothetical protein
MWRLTWDKLISESHGDLSRCTPCREKLIHTPCMLLTLVHIHHSYAFHRQSPYMATFHSNPIELDGPYCSWEKGSWHNPQHGGWSIRRFATQFLSQHSHWDNNESQTSVDDMLHRFTGLISPAYDQYVQYLLAEANLSVLNPHRWGLQPWRC